jgi:hypothetical protein
VRARSRDGHTTAKEQQCCRNDTACTCGWPARERLLVRIGVCLRAPSKDGIQRERYMRKATDGCLASSPMDVIAQFDRQRPARLSLIARCSGFVAILNARRADRFLRRATPWLSHKELVLLLRGAFVQMKRENHGSKHRTLWETLSTALRKLAGRECLPCRAYELVRPTHEEPVEGA